MTTLPVGIKIEPLRYNPNKTLEEVRREYIILALEYYGRDKQRAAKALGVSDRTLYNILAKMNLIEEYRLASPGQGRKKKGVVA